MEEEKYQKELFPLEKPKRTFPSLSGMLPKPDFERNILITLSLEKVIFISIGIIMLVVLVYALGVEVGKSRAAERIVPRATATKEMNPQLQAKATVIQAGPQQLPVQKIPVKPGTVMPAPKTAAAIQNPDRPFVIAAGAYSRKENAMAAMTKLRQAGFNAYLGQSQPFFQVWIGYKTADEAQKDLARVKKLCKDAYLKPRQ